MAVTISKNNMNFIKDGKPFFYLADTCWSAFTNIHPTDWEYYLQYRKRQGYNVLQINILPQWDASATDLQYSPYVCNTSGEYRFDKINEEYFTHAREMCVKAKEYGFELALVVLWCNYVPGTWANNMLAKNTMPFDKIKEYVNVVHQTFSDLQPMYMISGDTDLEQEKSRSYYIEASDELRKLAPTCLQTLHVRGRLMEIPDNLIKRIDFYMYQSGHNAQIENKCMPYRLAQYFVTNYPTKPLINAEPCYEQMGYSQGMYGRFHEFDIRRAAWQSLLSGACAGITYGAAGVYSWHTYGKEFDKKIGEGFDSPNPWHFTLHYSGAWDYSDIRSILNNHNIQELFSRQDMLINETEEIRVATTTNEKKILIYVPENTIVKLDLNLQSPKDTVTIIDLQTRHQEQGNVYYEEGKCCIGMHLFEHDALYIINRQ
jgi:hypothetical protein